MWLRFRWYLYWKSEFVTLRCPLVSAERILVIVYNFCKLQKHTKWHYCIFFTTVFMILIWTSQQRHLHRTKYKWNALKFCAVFCWGLLCASLSWLEYLTPKVKYRRTLPARLTSHPYLAHHFFWIKTTAF